MTSIGLCLLAFVAVSWAGRRSTADGLIAVAAVGYVYGITRANITETFSHFIFDAAIAALYLTYRAARREPPSASARELRRWTMVLIAWPALLFLVPLQDWAIQVVGLRGNLLLLPLIIIGASLGPAERYRVAMGLAVLNLLAFGMAALEYVYGIEQFFPEGPVTRIIHQSRDVAEGEFRIPSTFSSAHAYGGTMAASLPLLFGAWTQRASTGWRAWLVGASLAASLLGIFVAGARTPVVAGLLLVVATLFSIPSRRSHRLAWLVILLSVGWVVSSEERLQRFTTLADTEALADRLHGSINISFVEIVREFPLGNGLGSGTSVPYFLEERLSEVFMVENEYARIALELGVPGLLLWVSFAAWAFWRSVGGDGSSWRLARRLAVVSSATSFAFALTGTGLLTAIPATCLFLLNVGWMIAGRGDATPSAPPAARARPAAGATSPP